MQDKPKRDQKENGQEILRALPLLSVPKFAMKRRTFFKCDFLVI